MVAACNSSALDLAMYGDLLQSYAPAGKVAYAELKKNDFARLKKLYRSLDREDLKTLDTPNGELAFWMNAYNVVVLYEATKVYPARHIGGADKHFFKVKHPVAGRNLSLDEIEKHIREKFRDARIHFGVNCGAASCPLLATQPYTAENVKTKLDLNATLFINDDANVKFDEKTGELRLSEIFKWYADDFVRDAGSVEKYLARYLSEEKQKLLGSRQWKLAYIPYDWSPNAAGLR
jgi:hypothetical protein